MKTTRLVTTLMASLFFAGGLFAAEDQEAATVLASLKKKYPSTTFKSVTASQLPGIYEVIMGKNIAYVERSGRYFLFGHLFDMQTQTDLTEPKMASTLSKIDTSELPPNDAIVTVQGNGSRKISVFTDPDCPYCKTLSATLASLDNVTIHTYLFPIAQLHPTAVRKSISAWCASDRSSALSKLMLQGEFQEAECDNPIERNIALAERLGFNGTPTVILEDGSVLPGAPSAAKLEELMSTIESINKVANK